MVGPVLTRRRLLQTGLAGGALLVAPPLAQAAPPDADVANLRLLVGVELLTRDFCARALASGKLEPAARAVVKRIREDECAHYESLASLLKSLGQTPATARDMDFTYPSGTFNSQRTILRLGTTLETLSLGAYLGGVENVQTAELRLPLGQIAANEAQHACAIGRPMGACSIGRPFAPALQIDAVSAALDRYER
jgi:hypothetical protein